MQFAPPVLLFCLVLGSAPLAAAADPAVTTGGASGVTDLKATLHGVVNPGSGNLVYSSFEFGTSMNYTGSVSASPLTSGGPVAEAFSAAVDFLLPNTTYHYRAVSRHAYTGVAYYGTNQSFTTGAPNTPPSFNVTGGDPETTAAQVGAYGIRAGSSPATLSVEYGLTEAYGSTHAWPQQIALNQVGSVNHTLTGLTPSTTYHYRLKAVNAQGTTYSEDQTFRTLDPPVITTDTPSNITDLTARINGTINARNGGYNCEVEYGTTTAYGSRRATQAFVGDGNTPLSVPLDDLQASTLYHYRIRLIDTESTYYGEDHTFTTGPAATPPRINSVTAWVSNNTPTQADVAVRSGFSGSSPTTLSFEYGTTIAYGSTATRPGTIPANTSWAITDPQWLTLTGLTPSTEYHFRARLSNAEGTVYSADTTFTTPPGVSVVSQPASGVTDLAATLNGTVNTQGEYLNLWFEYGTTTDYGQTMSVGSFFSNWEAQPFSARPPRLLPATTYHYRLRGVNWYSPQHEFVGTDQTFTTGEAATPPSADLPHAAYMTSTTAQLRCQTVSSGSSPATTVFDYGLTTAYGMTATADQVIPTNQTATPTVTVSNLSPGTLYHLRCTVTNAQGSVTSEDTTFTTVNTPVVTTEAATYLTDLSVTLNGTVTSAAEVYAHFELGTTTAYGTSVHVSSPSNFTAASPQAVNVALSGLQPGTTYHYRAFATFVADPSAVFYGPDITFTTAAAATPPRVTTAGYVHTLRPTYAVVQGSASAGSSTATLEWEYGTTTAYGGTATASPATLATGAAQNVTGSFYGLQPSTTYHYRLKATNDEGATLGEDATFTTPAGPTLTTNAAANVTDLSATFSGRAIASPSGEGVILSFEYGTTPAYGKIPTGTPSSSITGSVVTVTQTVTGLLPDTTYHYRLRASAVPVSSPPYVPLYYGQDMTFTTGPAATPPTVSNTQTPRSGTGLQITTAQVRADVFSGSSPASVVCEYGLDTTYGSQVAHTQPLDTSTTTRPVLPLTGLLPGTTYHFRIVATNQQGTATGPDISFTTLSPPTVTTTAAQVKSMVYATLQGSYNLQGGQYSVDFEYGTTTAYGSSVPAGAFSGGGGGTVIIIGGGSGGGLIVGGGGTITIGGPTFIPDFTTRDAAATITNLTPGATYHYRLRLTDETGNRHTGADATFTTAATPSEAWRLTHFNSAAGAGPAADEACPAGDGIPNLMKYALRMNPNIPGALPAPQTREHEGRKHLTLSFERDPYGTDLHYEVQAADNPDGPWANVTEIIAGGAPTGDGFVSEDKMHIVVLQGMPPAVFRDTIEVRDPVSMQDAPRRFMRLKVTRLP